MKNYQRWPRNEKKLFLRLKKLFKEIDVNLTPKFSIDCLKEENIQEEYREEFLKQFNEVGYKWDEKPRIYFNWINRHVSGLAIIVYLKRWDGLLIKINI